MEEKDTAEVWKRKGNILLIGIFVALVVAFAAWILRQGSPTAQVPSSEGVCIHYFANQEAVDKGQPFETEFPQGRYIHFDLARGIIFNPPSVEEECILYFVNEEARVQGNPFQFYSPTTGWVVLLDPLAPSQSQ